MTVTEELRKTLSDPKPLYALAGAGDLAAEKLKDAPALINDVAGNVSTLANRIAAEAPERLAKVQSRLAEVPGALGQVTSLDPKAARESLRGAASKADPQALREKAQALALIQVGRVLEAAGKAVETYDELAERGRAVVGRYRGDTVVGQVTVVVEQVEVEDSETNSAAGGSAASEVEDADVAPEPGTAARTKPGPASGAGTSNSSNTSSTSDAARSRHNAASKTTVPKSTGAKPGPTGHGAKS